MLTKTAAINTILSLLLILQVLSLDKISSAERTSTKVVCALSSFKPYLVDLGLALDFLNRREFHLLSGAGALIGLGYRAHWQKSTLLSRGLIWLIT